MNSQSSPTTPPSSTPVEGPRKTPVKALWAAVAVLAVAAAAFGGMLLGQNRQSPTNTPAAVSAPAFSTGSTAPNDGVPPPPLAPAPNAVAANPSPEPVRAPPVQSSQASGPAAAPGAGADASAPAVAPAPPAPICKTCGHVESIRTVQREQPTSGVGAVAGGVLGGVLGNQVGSGNGRTAATVLGAVGGGYVGNTVEKRTHTITRYQVAVRMDDGSIRTVETRSAPPIGKAVTLKGGVLRPADRRL